MDRKENAWVPAVCFLLCLFSCTTNPEPMEFVNVKNDSLYTLTGKGRKTYYIGKSEGVTITDIDTLNDGSIYLTDSSLLWIEFKDTSYLFKLKHQYSDYSAFDQ